MITPQLLLTMSLPPDITIKCDHFEILASGKRARLINVKHQQWKAGALLAVAFCIHYCTEFLILNLICRLLENFCIYSLVIIFNGHLRSRLKMYVEKHTKHQVIKMRKLTMFITRGFIIAVCVLYLIICWNIILYAIWLVYALWSISGVSAI